MLDHQVERICVELRQRGVEPFTWRFFFDEAHAEARNQAVVSDAGVQTLLQALIDRLDDGRRAVLFPHRFDLGNKREDATSYEEVALRAELFAEFYSENSDPLKPGSAFKHIDPWIEESTGLSISQHAAKNAPTTFKVLKLLYRAIKRRRSHVLRSLRIPGGKVRPSMETRDRFPLEKNGAHVWIIADFMSYLSLEMEVSRIQRIRDAFDLLIPSIDELVSYIDSNIEHNAPRDVADAQIFSDRLVSSLLDDRDLSVDAPYIALDERLYFHLHALTFLNFAEELAQIRDLTTPRVPLHAIPREIERLRDAVARDGGSPYSGGPVASSTDSHLVYRRWRPELMELIGRAVGHALTNDDYDSLIAPSQELLYRVWMFRWGVPDPTIHKHGILEYLVAACAIWHEMNEKTAYKPYWMGQQAQGKRLLPTLAHPIRERGAAGAELVPEALNHIWVGRYLWVSNCLKGNAVLSRVRADAAIRVLRHLSSVVKLGDIEALERHMPAQFPMIRSRVDLLPG